MRRSPEQRPAFQMYQELIEELGVDMANRFIKRFGGEQMYVPTFRTILRFSRDQQIRSESIQGKSIRELSIEFGLSQMRISQVLRGK